MSSSSSVALSQTFSPPPRPLLTYPSRTLPFRIVRCPLTITPWLGNLHGFSMIVTLTTTLSELLDILENTAWTGGRLGEHIAH